MSLLGPQYPKLTAISSHPIFQEAMHSLEETLHTKLDSAPYNSTAFSLSVFSASDDPSVLAWQYHHTPSSVAESMEGTQEVNADSIYRIGSISKLLTVFVFLITEGDVRFGDPVSKYLPELVELQADGGGAYATPNWEEITLGDLAGQVAGLARDYKILQILRQIMRLLASLERQTDVGLGEFATEDNAARAKIDAEVLSAFSQDEAPACNYNAPDETVVECTEQEYLLGVAASGTIFPSASRAAYSNQAYAILGLALSRITGKSMPQLLASHIVDTLNLAATTYTAPVTTASGVIGPDRASSGWDNEFGVFVPAGGNFASSHDMAAIGRAMLISELLPPAMTRRWFKHVSFVNDLHQGVGLPWEVVRLDGALNRTIDIYGKSGDWGVYSTLLALVPDYNIGFTILTALEPSEEADVRTEVSNLISPLLIEAVDAVAQAQAADNFAGTYSSSASNSSITVTTDEDSALRLMSWTHDGKDIFNGLVGRVAENPDWRLLPNDLYDSSRGVGFTSLFQKKVPEKLYFGALL